MTDDQRHDLAHDLAIASGLPEEPILEQLRRMDAEAAEWHRDHPDAE